MTNILGSKTNMFRRIFVLDEIKYGEIMLDYLGGFTIISRVFISGKEEQTKRKPERWKCEKNLTCYCWL